MENNPLVFITPMAGASILGKLVTEDYEHFSIMEEPICKLDEAIICERIRIQIAPGQFDLTFLAIPIDVFDQSPKTIFVKVATYLVVEEDSRLAKFYKETLKQWQIQRAGLVQPTPQELSNVQPLNRGNGK